MLLLDQAANHKR